MNENKPNNEPAVNEEGLAESNAAKRLRLTGEGMGEEQDFSDIPRDFKSRLANFWYHHKVKVIVTAFFAFAIGVCIAQFASHTDPDVRILYGGPGYITPMDNERFCSAVREIMTEDYNGDGEKKIRLTDVVFFTQNQLDAAKAAAEERGEDFDVDPMQNQSNYEKFDYEVFSDNAIICILSEEQYKRIASAEGFIPLAEIFGEEEIKGAIDQYGVRFRETNFYEYYESTHIFPEDAVLALRRISTISALTGKAKAEKLHAYHTEIFKKMADFEFPEGYKPKG